MKSLLFPRLLAAALCAAVSFPLLAQSWPARPVTLLVPFAAGGTVDIVARTLGQRLGAELGQNFVVDNRSGAGGAIATTALARAAPDGHTLLFHHMGLVFNAALVDNLPYDTRRNLVPVAYIGATPNVLVVNNALPIRTVAEFLAAARAKPGTINYGSGGVGSAGHLPMELLRSITHIDVVHVPYKGSGPAIADLLGGQIQTMLLTIPAVMPYITAGTLRPIATSGKRRSPALPNLPTIAESGVPGFEYSPWYGVFAPAGTSAAVLAKIHAALNKVLEDPEINRKLASQGLEVQPMTREEFASIVGADLAKWAQIIRALDIKEG
jgi:tripartite-type tricarboxylate transporter receptor subunit TctC